MEKSLCLFLQDSIGLLLDAVRTSNEDLAQTWKKSEQWATIEQLCSESPLYPPYSKVIFCRRATQIFQTAGDFKGALTLGSVAWCRAKTQLPPLSSPVLACSEPNRVPTRLPLARTSHCDTRRQEVSLPC